MSIRLTCSCGEALIALDVFAGGQIKCGSCEDMVPVPLPVQEANDKERVHFPCPHCETRVIGRRKSIGKLSKCPSCEGVYIIPDPGDLPHDSNDDHDDWTEDDRRKWPASQSQSWSDRPAKRYDIDVDDVMFLPGMLDQIEQTPNISLDEIRRIPIGRRRQAKPPQYPSMRHAKSHAVPHQPPPPKLLPEAAIPAPQPIIDSAQPPTKVTQTSSSIQPQTITSQPPAPAPQNSNPQPQSTAQPGAVQPENAPKTSPTQSVALLRFPTGEFADKPVSLDAKTFIIGRERDCNLRLQSDALNRHHCAIRSDGFSVRIQDLGSETGTFINEIPCERETELHHRDIVRIGDIKMQLILPQGLIEENIPLESIPMLDDFTVF